LCSPPFSWLSLHVALPISVSTMDLSEARGLVLFRVIRGGIEISQRLGAEHRVYRPLSYSPSNPSVSRTDWPPPEKITGDGRALRSEEHTSELQSPDHLVCL